MPKPAMTPKRFMRIAETLLVKAEEGGVSAIKEVADRLDGKVTRGIVGDDEHPPVGVKIVERVVVRSPADSDS